MSMNKMPDPEETQFLSLSNFVPGAPAKLAGEGMTTFIKRAAEETLGEGEQPVVLPQNSGTISPATLLGAVTYCYASDVYESERIEHKFYKDETFKSAVGHHLPGASAIRRFRRLNRDAILKVLEKAYRLRRRKEKEETSAVAAPADSDQTVFFARACAEQKLELAVMLDQPN